MDVATVIEAPAEKVWCLLIDTRSWIEWGPSVAEVDCRERFLRHGLRGRLRSPFGLWVPFEITEFDPPRRWSWQVAGIPATGHRVEPLGANRCRLVFEVPAIALPYAAVCRVAGRRLASLVADEPDPQREHTT